MTDAIKDDQEPFNSIGLIPLKSFYGSKIKLNGELGKMYSHCLIINATKENVENLKIVDVTATLPQIN